MYCFCMNNNTQGDFQVCISVPSREKRKKTKGRKAWAKGFFREGKNKDKYHEMLQNMRVSEKEDHFRYISI